MNLFKNIKENITSSDKKVFLTACIAGFIAHGFRLTNKFYCEDSFNYLKSISASWTTSIGRFLLRFVENVRGPYEVTWLIGILSILWIAIASVLMVRTLDIKKESGRYLVPCIMACNPAVTATFAYMYTADGYFFGLMMSILAAYLACIKRRKRDIAYAAVALAVSMGFYQAYLSVTIVALMISLMIMTLDPAKTVKDVGKEAGRYTLMGIIGMGIYYPAMKIAMKLADLELVNYMGIADGQKFDASRIKNIFVNSYIEFARFYLVRKKITFYNVSNVAVFAIIGILIAALFIKGWRGSKKKDYSPAWRIAVILVLLLLLPVATHIFFVISPDVSYISAIMAYSMCLVYILPVILWEKIDPLKSERLNGVRTVGLIFLWVITFHFTVIAGQAYESMYRANVNVMNELNRIVTRMEMIPGYDPEMEIAVFGNTYQEPDYVKSAPMMPGVVSNKFLTYPDTYVSAINWFMSARYQKADKDRMKELAATDEFSEMKRWPEDGSVKIIDGTMVIFLDDNDLYEYQ
ncbi:MAG: glucosyltransferase domain-containing protein [Lachnospiraceae bacterium]|nr:glucosyltransferase domain-containing protein [Lachnospiraceae bacterium]